MGIENSGEAGATGYSPGRLRARAIEPNTQLTPS
jgi:hypothetical protein